LTLHEEESYFRAQADECRRQAGDLPPCDARRQLVQLAGHYDGEARRRTLEIVRGREF
jgi:hypothetical protein